MSGAEVPLASTRQRTRGPAPTSRAGEGTRTPRRGVSLGFVVAFVARRGVLLPAMATVLGIEVAVMAQRGAQWRGDLIWTIDWLPVAFVVIGPVVTGFAAVDVARLTVGSAHLSRNRVAGTPAFAVMAAYSIGTGAVHLAVILGSLVVSRPPVGDWAAFLAVGVHVLIIMLFAATGALIGRFVSPVLAGIAAALAALVGVYLFSSQGEHVALLHAGGATIPRIGYAYSPGYLLAQAAMLILVVCAALVLRPLEGSRARRVTVRDALVSAAACSGAVAISIVGPGERLIPTTAAPTHCGSVLSVPTCFYPQHARVAQSFQDQFWVLVDVAQENGYDLVPERVEEASRTVVPMGPDVSPFYIMPEHLQGQDPTLWEVASGLVQPVHCPQVQGELPPSDRYWADLDALTATWVGLADPSIGEEMGWFGDPLAPEEAARLADEFRTCTYPYF